MFDDAFQAGTDAAARDLISRPPPVPRPAPSFSLWSFTKDTLGGIPAGIQQRAAGIADVVGGFGQVLGAYPEAMGPGVNLSPTQRIEADTQRKKLLAGGVDMTSEVGTMYRDAAAQFLPDPTTAHAANQIASGFTRFISKAALPGGPVSLAMDEGLTVADDLKRKGVDLETRTKVGAVAAVAAPVATLPMVGSTLRATAALYAAQPASYIAQQAATREILARAGYDSIASTYDPLDPLGLSLAALVPLPFAALGVRGIRAKAERAKADGVAAAERDFAAGPIPSEKTPIALASEEVVDAARVNLLGENLVNTAPHAPSDLPAFALHEEAYGLALRQISAGEPVNVGHLIGADGSGRIAEALTPRLAEAERAARVPLPDETTAAAEPPAAASGPTIGDFFKSLAADPADASARTDAASTAPDSGNPAPARPPGLAEAIDQGLGASGDHAAAFERNLAHLEAAAPDLPVGLADGTQSTLKQAIADVRSAFEAESSDASLAQVAAECFLRTGS